jgi:mannose-6-phosphate isomerase-like protein (cupin superfamily)
MSLFETLALAEAPLVKAPDGSDVRPLVSLAGGSLAHFELAPGKTSIAVAHRSVEEIWFVTGGRGEMWRKGQEREEITPLAAGVSLTIPAGTAFQFRSFGTEPLTMVAITMPPWPGEGEAYEVAGTWPASL